MPSQNERDFMLARERDDDRMIEDEAEEPDEDETMDLEATCPICRHVICQCDAKFDADR